MLETLFDSVFVIIKKKVPVFVEHLVIELFVDVQHTCVSHLQTQDRSRCFKGVLPSFHGLPYLWHGPRIRQLTLGVVVHQLYFV